MNSTIEQLQNILDDGPVWDGNLIDKSARTRLMEAGYVEKINGWNFLTKAGVLLCSNLRLLVDRQGRVPK